MKIAITADAHLRRRDETPERYVALEKILEEISKLGITDLIIAGDTFDKESSNYSDFESLCNRYPHIRVVLLPGNHDPEIKQRFFGSKQIRVFEEPGVESINDLAFVFVPYRPVQTIDEVIAELKHNGRLPEKWVLVGHGDYIAGRKEINPYEPGSYMFITRSAIKEHSPLHVILGHIHKPSVIGAVIYPGSPHPIDINETGKRRFIVYDTAANEIEEVIVPTDRIYFIETLTVFPGDDEIEIMRRKIDSMVKTWNLSEEELRKAQLRLLVRGYCYDKQALTEALKNHLAKIGITLYDEGGPDFSELGVVSEVAEEKIGLLQRAIEKLDEYSLGEFSASKDDIIAKMMEFVFGKKQ